MFDEPESIEKEASQVFNNSVKLINIYGDIGIEFFLTASDIADNSGPYFPPVEFEKFILPYLSRWTDHIKNLGGYSIMHSDGNIDMYIDKIAQTSLNALQAIDPVAGMEILKLKRKVGNSLCLCGNINCSTVISDPPEIIYAEATKLLEQLSPYPGFSFGVSNVLEQDTAKENFEALVKAYFDFNNSKKKLIRTG